MVDVIVFAISAAIILGGALGVILSSHPVRAALSLIASFFGVAVLFVLHYDFWFWSDGTLLFGFVPIGSWSAKSVMLRQQKLR